MVDLKLIASKAVMLIEANSAEILTGLSLAGVVMTGITAGEARLKADDIILQIEADLENDALVTDNPPCVLTFGDKFRATWWCYILPVSLGIATMGCIVGSHKIQGKKLAALAGAYSITDGMFKEYRKKVQEKLGKKKAEEIDHDINQDLMGQYSTLDNDILATNHGDVLCVDKWSGQKFYSNAAAIKEAVNQVNAIMVDDIYVDLNTLYDELGLPPTKAGEDTGWNALADKKIRVKLDSCLDKDHVPCLAMEIIPCPRPMFKDC